MMREDKNSKMTNKNFTGAVVWPTGGAVRWLIHSVPRFPPDPRQGTGYRYPDSGIQNGQSFLCIRANYLDLIIIANDLFYTWPWIYAHNNPDVSRFRILWRVLYAGPIKNHQPKRYDQAAVQTIGQFTIFSKAGGYNGDIYKGLMAPYFQDQVKPARLSMYVKTWIRRRELPSDCRGGTNVYNVDRIERLVGYNYQKSQDHSKWAITNTYYVCVGGLNRMTTQAVRGGSSMCLKAPSLAAQIGGSIKYVACGTSEEIEPVNFEEWQKSAGGLIRMTTQAERGGSSMCLKQWRKSRGGYIPPNILVPSFPKFRPVLDEDDILHVPILCR